MKRAGEDSPALLSYAAGTLPKPPVIRTPRGRQIFSSSTVKWRRIGASNEMR